MPKCNLVHGLAGLVGLVLIEPVAARADDYCARSYAASASATEAAYMPQIDALKSEIKRVQDAGLKPDQYVVEFEGSWSSLTDKANMLVTRYRDQMAKAAGESEGCAKAVAPANVLANGAVQLGAIWMTSGLSLLLPQRTLRVDMGEVMNGRPFGGPRAIVPEVREALLGGSRGMIANIVRDPWKCVTFQRKC